MLGRIVTQDPVQRIIDNEQLGDERGVGFYIYLNISNFFFFFFLNICIYIHLKIYLVYFVIVYLLKLYSKFYFFLNFFMGKSIIFL